MKKIFFGLAVFFAMLTSAQMYPDYYPNSGYGNSDYYGDYDDEFYFPDDYYYEYPSDYYSNGYYESCYNDYRNSIMAVNWNRFFRTYNLSPWQIEQIMLLNGMYPSYASWNSYYRFNPDRWYYDRFFALQRILGPRIFVVYQNNYFHGHHPVAYFQSYRRDYYVPRYRVMPRYRNINVNVYKVDKVQYHQSNPRANYSFKNESRVRNTTSADNTRASGFRNDNKSSVRTNTGVRTQNSNSVRPNTSVRTPNNTSTRSNSGTAAGNVRSNNSVRTPNSNQNSIRNNSSLRNTTPQRNVESNNRTQQNRSTAPQSGSTRNSGMRLTSR